MTVETPAPQLDESELARQYGWAMSVLNSDDGLKGLFHQAVSENWGPAKFAALVRDTDWYKTHSESARQNIVLQATDPTTYAAKRDNSRTQFYALAAKMGADISGGQADGLAQNAFDLGWSEQQIQNVLGQYIDFTKPGYGGIAASAEDDLREYARSMGVKMDEGSIANWARQEAMSGGGGTGVGLGKQIIQQTAASAFPPLADRIKAGETVDSIAAPYKQSMANTLEINSEGLDLYDPSIRQALLTTGKDGKPSTKSLWQFERDLKDDPRWMGTKNAQDSVMTTTRKVLTDMGLAT